MQPVPFTFDLSTIVPRSVAKFYSHLVTRPTGAAIRLGIETQIGEIGTVCLSVLDFTQVLVLDYSCADEVVAKLIQRYTAEDRPADAYFVARGLGEQHRDPIDEVLIRHNLALVAEVEGQFVLLGSAEPMERDAWNALQSASRREITEIATLLDAPEPDVARALDRLAKRRVILRGGAGSTAYYSLTALLPTS